MIHSIATIINFCTNDYQFLRFNVQQLKKFSRKIIVPYGDHFFDGSVENSFLLTQAIKENPEAEFVKFEYDPQTTRNFWRGWQAIARILGLGRVFGSQYWICYARYLGWQQVDQSIDYVLFLDADEIVDGQRFLDWLNTGQYQKFNALKPANYWYWRSPCYQATVWEDSALMARYSCLKKAIFFDHDERNATYNSVLNPKTRKVLGSDKKPLIHHYGWAKSKAQLIKKAQTWGHARDRNWVKLIETEFSKPFSGTDFIYKRQYKIVKPFSLFNKG